MPHMMFCMLAAILRLGGHAEAYDVIELSGYPMQSLASQIRTAKDLGWIERRSGLYWLTERGKIALAIEEGRQSSARARGQKHRWFNYAKFEELHKHATRRKQEGRASRQREAAGWAGDAERSDARRCEDGAEAG
jgi:hypothetical protein